MIIIIIMVLAPPTEAWLSQWGASAFSLDKQLINSILIFTATKTEECMNKYEQIINRSSVYSIYLVGGGGGWVGWTSVIVGFMCKCLVESAVGPRDL